MSIPTPAESKQDSNGTDALLGSRVWAVLLALVVAGAGLAMLASPAAANHGGDAIVVDDAGDGDFTTIDDATAHASPGDTIEVRSGTYNEAIFVSTNDTGAELDGLTIAAETADGGNADVTVDATGNAKTVADIRANSVMLQNLTLTWDGEQSDNVHGVHVQAAGAQLTDLSIELPAGFCSVQNGNCSGPDGTGVQADAGVTIDNLDISADLVNATDQRAAATHGVNANTEDPVVVNETTVEGFGMGVVTWGEDTTVLDSTFTQNVRGVQVAADGVEVRGSAFTGHVRAVYIAGTSPFSPQDVTLRQNDFDLSNTEALAFEDLEDDTVEDAVIDAELNFWGVVKEELIEESRIGWTAGNRVNDVDFHPYLNANGAQIPPKPAVNCIIDENRNVTSVTQTRTLQAAVDVSLDSECKDYDEDGTVERIIVLDPSFEEYEGAVIDTQVRLESSATEGVDDGSEATQGAVDFGARIQAQSGEPGLRFVDGSQNSHVEGIGIQGEPVGTTAIRAEDISGDSGITIEDVGTGSRNDESTQALAVREVTNLTVTSSTFLSGDTTVTLEATTDTTIEDSRIAVQAPRDAPGGDATAVAIQGAEGPSLDDNTILGNAVEGSTAIEIVDANEPVVFDNVVANTIEGIVVETSTEATIENNTLAFPAVTSASDTIGIELVDGANATVDRNTIQVAETGLGIDGTTGVEGDLNRFNGTTTGVNVANLAEDELDGVTDLALNNGTKAATLRALVLEDTTANLDVNVECNDWGVYQRDLIHAQRIFDGGENNDVDAQPFTSPNKNSGEVECLVPPKAEFSFAPEESITRLDEIDFIDESESGTYDIDDWAWDFDNGNTSTEQNPTMSYDSVGTFFVELTVSDRVNMSSSKVHKVQVENLEPELSAVPDPTFEHNDELSFDVEVSNFDIQQSEGDNVTIEAYELENGEETPLPANAQFQMVDNSTGTFTFSPNADQDDSYDILFRADDGYNTTTAESTVTVVNQAPVYDPELPDLVGGVEGDNVTIEANALDPDDGDEVDSLAVDISELPGNATVTGTTDNTTRTVEWPTETDDAGSYNVSFTATSPAKSTTEEVTIEIRETNAPPSLTISGETTQVDGEIATLEAQADDPENDDINWSLETDPAIDGDSLQVQGNESQWVWDVPAGTNGTYNVTFSAADTFDGEVSATETVTIKATPYLDTLLPRETETDTFTLEPLVGSTTEFAFWAEDPDGVLTSSELSVEIGSASGSQTFTPEVVDASAEEPRKWAVQTPLTETGPHYVNVTAVDDEGYETFENTTFIVQENEAPNITLEQEVVWANATDPFGATVTLEADAVDPEGRSIDDESFVWSVESGPTLKDPSVNVTLPVGTHNVQLEVTDPIGVSATETVVVNVDDTIAVDGALDATDQGDFYQVDPTQRALEELTGTATVTNDLGNGVDSSIVTGTVIYYGAEANDQGVGVGSFEVTTNASGVADFSFDQEIAGAAGGQSILSAPGWHEIALTADAASRDQAPDNDQEVDRDSILYFVSPNVPPEGPDTTGAHAEAACYDAPASEDNRSGAQDEARVAVEDGAPTARAPAPGNVAEGAQTFAEQGADCKRGYAQATLLALGTYVQACYDGEVHIQLNEGQCPTSEESTFDPPAIPGGNAGQALAAGLQAEGACFYKDDGGEDTVQATADLEGLDATQPDLEAAQSALIACARGLTSGELPQGGSYLAVTGTAGDEAVVVTVNTVPASDLVTGEDENATIAAVEGQGACYYGGQGAEDEASVFLGPPAPDTTTPAAENVAAALTACGSAATDGSMPEGGSYARFTATMAGSTVAVSVDTVPLSDALT